MESRAAGESVAVGCRPSQRVPGLRTETAPCHRSIVDWCCIFFSRDRRCRSICKAFVGQQSRVLLVAFACRSGIQSRVAFASFSRQKGNPGPTRVAGSLREGEESRAGRGRTAAGLQRASRSVSESVRVPRFSSP